MKLSIQDILISADQRNGRNITKTLEVSLKELHDQVSDEESLLTNNPARLQIGLMQVTRHFKALITQSQSSIAKLTDISLKLQQIMKTDIGF